MTSRIESGMASPPRLSGMAGRAVPRRMRRAHFSSSSSGTSSNGIFVVSSSIISTPNEYTSLAFVNGLFFHTSGATKAKVPDASGFALSSFPGELSIVSFNDAELFSGSKGVETCPDSRLSGVAGWCVGVEGPERKLERPKSAIFMVSPETKMFDAFRSRWWMRLWCRNAIPFAICCSQSSLRDHVTSSRAPLAMSLTTFRRLPFAQYSVTMASLASSNTAPRIARMLGCLRWVMMSTSFFQSSMSDCVGRFFVSITFTATSVA
eukprot:gene19643-biopygen19913